MKVLFVTREHEHERRYGLGKSLEPVAEGLATLGHHVEYLCQAQLGPRSRALQSLFNSALHQLAPLLPGRTDHPDVLGAVFERFGMARLAAAVAKSGRFEVVHAHDPVIGFGLRRRLRFAAAPPWGLTQHGFGGFAANMHAHGIHLGARAQRRLTDLERTAVTAARWVLFPSRLALDRMLADAGLPAAPATWHVVPHPRPTPKRHERAQARRELGWDQNELYVVGVGQLVPVKRFDTLVDACVNVSRKRPLRLCLLGEGDADSLRSAAASAGFADRLSIRVTDDVGRYLAAADLYVSTSASESFGIANLEALCAGCPAICTGVGSVPEVVDGGALLVPPDDAARLEDAMLALLTDDAARARLASRGQAHAQSWPLAAEIAEQHETIYREALGASHRRLGTVSAS